MLTHVQLDVAGNPCLWHLVLQVLDSDSPHGPLLRFFWDPVLESFTVTLVVLISGA